MNKKDLLEIVSKLHEISRDSKSLYENLKILKMESICSIPIIDGNSISAYENFINTYINNNGTCNYNGLEEFYVDNVTIFTNTDPSDDAIGIYFCSWKNTGNIAFFVAISIDSKLSLEVDDADEIVTIEDIVEDFSEELAKVR